MIFCIFTRIGSFVKLGLLSLGLLSWWVFCHWVFCPGGSFVFGSFVIGPFVIGSFVNWVFCPGGSFVNWVFCQLGLLSLGLLYPLQNLRLHFSWLDNEHLRHTYLCNEILLCPDPQHCVMNYVQEYCGTKLNKNLDIQS